MKYKELIALNKDELDKKETDAKLELMKLNSQVATGTNPKNPHQVREFKKILARIKTLKNKNDRN